MNYRKEIDGLRAIAVIPVILFHAGFAFASGGYIGVDIFLVISGYLITNIILKEQEKGIFSISSFYERRARRILPALFLTMLLCIPFALIWMLPIALTNFSESILATTFFSSNIFFWREAGYFDSPSELKPLLHTWSLALEEQFYIFFPVLMLLLYKTRVFFIISSLSILLILSLYLSQWGALNYPTANFYLLPSRGWELLVGSLAAIFIFYKSEKKIFIIDNRFFKNCLGIIGSILIIFSIIEFDDSTPFPSFWTLYPVLGALLIILFSDEETIVGKFLSFKPLVFLGLISYSLYLFHQPIFAFAKIYTFGSLKENSFIALILISIFLSFLSWKFIETPFRNTDLISKKVLLKSIFLSVIIFSTFSFITIKNLGFHERFDVSNDIKISLSRDDNEDCFAIENSHFIKKWGCNVGENKNKYDFFISGDSHANTYLNAFDRLSIKNKKKGFFAGLSGCPPLLGINTFDPDGGIFDCKKLNERTFNFIKDNNIKNIILISRWSYYTYGDYNKKDIRFLKRKENDVKNLQTSRDNFIYGLKNTIKRYSDIGVKVNLISQYPQQKINPNDIYYRKLNSDDLVAYLQDLSIDRDQNNKLNEFADNAFLNIKSKNFKSYDFDNILCNKKCFIGDKSGSFYYDDDHLSDYGMNLIDKELNKIIQSF